MDRRINISLPSETHTALRIYCVQHGQTMAEVIVEALRRLLAANAEPARKP
jgi:plasmid stability protein